MPEYVFYLTRIFPCKLIRESQGQKEHAFWYILSSGCSQDIAKTSELRFISSRQYHKTRFSKTERNMVTFQQGILYY